MLEVKSENGGSPLVQGWLLNERHIGGRTRKQRRAAIAMEWQKACIVRSILSVVTRERKRASITNDICGGLSGRSVFATMTSGTVHGMIYHEGRVP